MRTKPGYTLDDGATALGFRVELTDARAEATLARSRSWVDKIEGHERVRFSFPGLSAQSFDHRFELARDDALYVEVATQAADQAMFATGHRSEPQVATRVDQEMLKLTYQQARERFVDLMQAEGRRGAFAAARQLAGWLRAHPDSSDQWLADLRAGMIPELAHPALFLGLELAGTAQSGKTLAAALVDERLSEVNRARAASALADHGAASLDTARLLREQVQQNSSTMVANVSLLGMGSLSSRAKGDSTLREELRDMLRDELSAERGEAHRLIAVDSIGNSADDALAPDLREPLSQGESALRAHAAEALGHMSSQVARPMLLAQLEADPSARVRTSIVQSLSKLEGSSSFMTLAERELAAQYLTASSDPQERAALIQWLGQSKSQAETRQVLAEHFRREGNVRLQQLIGSFVSSRELQEATL